MFSYCFVALSFATVNKDKTNWGLEKEQLLSNNTELTKMTDELTANNTELTKMTDQLTANNTELIKERDDLQRELNGK